MTNHLTYEIVKSFLAYDGKTGVFRWRVKRSRGVNAGDVAGSLMKSTGYWRVCILGRNVCAHRAAWLLTHGVWPNSFIDHANGNRLDNRIANLRLATNSQNQANRKAILSSSRVKGVTWSKHCKKWQASVKKDGKNHHLGTFDEKSEAAEAYRIGAKRLFGEFAA